ncbi:ABC transporter permease [Marinobacter changyiensis]|uniref:ABC transporter permease n=1 Tax=Marinobacter changyiensis TaxID=2604091 RepID=UPI0012659FB6|nr:ABC transporter permease [Marinobacter changyiensis]
MALYRALIRKEFLLLSRDPHGLLLLFVMPAVFVLIMTFALQNQYAMNKETRLDFFLVNQDGGSLSAAFARELGAASPFNRVSAEAPEQTLRQRARADEVMFLVLVQPDFESNLADRGQAVRLLIAPGTSPVFAGIAEGRVTELLNRFYLQYRMAFLPGISAGALDTSSSMVASESLFDDSGMLPSSVQHNVPAWLLFAMFFIAVPLSTTLIHERQQGTLMRLQTMGVSRARVLAGKVVPYLLVNLMQVLVLFLIGLYLIPLLGGDKLTLGNHSTGLVLVSVAASLAAVCYALFIAQITATVEQATIVAAVCNIIMAAIGGVMVPRFLMPETMRQLGDFSPMAWGLEGFFDILLRNGTVVDVLPETGGLVSFAALMLVLTFVFSPRSASA